MITVTYCYRSGSVYTIEYDSLLDVVLDLEEFRWRIVSAEIKFN